MEYVLIGNPNTGKTTFFNALTKSTNHVGNWHGVTNQISKKTVVFEGKSLTIYDLPGMYSLSPLGMEEKVATDYVRENMDKTYLTLCDSENIKRNLFLTISLAEREIKTIIIINNMGGKRKKEEFDFLNKLNIKYYLINPKNKKEINYLKSELIKSNKKIIIPKIIINYNIDEKTKKIEKIIEKTPNINEKTKKNLVLDYFCYDFTDDKSIKMDLITEEKIKKIITKNDLFNFISEKQKYIQQLFESSNYKQKAGHEKLDNLLLNKYFAFPIFFVIICAVFYLTFFLLGGFLSDILTFVFVDKIFGSFLAFLSTLSPPVWLFDFFSVAVVGGVGTVLGFLPQIILLQSFLTILENSGYISRIAFLFDDFFEKFGLSGKSAYTMIMGFGCSTSACMTARNMEEKNSKIKTALLTPYMSCSAKLPVYLALGGIFFGKWNIAVVVFLYFVGIVLSLLVSFALEKTILKSTKQTFLMELPSFQKTSLKYLVRDAVKNANSFLLRIGGVVLLANAIMFFFQGFDATLSYVGGSNKISLLQTFAMFLSPMFFLVGFANWRAVSALFSGFVAKEIVLSSLVMLCGGLSLGSVQSNLGFTTSSTLSFLCFFSLYMPCLATTSTLVREVGKNWTLFSLTAMLFIAYTFSAVVYWLAILCEIMGSSTTIIVLICLLFVFLLLFIIKKLSNKKNKCIMCTHNCLK